MRGEARGRSSIFNVTSASRPASNCDGVLGNLAFARSSGARGLLRACLARVHGHFDLLSHLFGVLGLGTGPRLAANLSLGAKPRLSSVARMSFAFPNLISPPADALLDIALARGTRIGRTRGLPGRLAGRP